MCLRVRHQPDCVLHVHFFAGEPFCGRRFRGNVLVRELAVHPRERFLDGYPHRLLELFQSPVSAVFKVDLAVLAAFAVETALMHEVMMVPAQQYEVIEARFAAIRPVPDVVTIDKLVICTAWEAATSVTGL